MGSALEGGEVMNLLSLSLLMNFGVHVCAASELFDGHTFYLGELHAHTGASGDGGSSDLRACDDVCGAVADLRSIAVSNGLDFFTITDHVNGGFAADAADFAVVMDRLRAENDVPHAFITLLGAEVQFKHLGSDLGHKSLLLFGSASEVASFDRDGAQPFSGTDEDNIDDCSEIGDFIDRIRADYGDALLVPHHPALSKPMATDWSCHEESWAPLVEIYSEHGTSDRIDTDYDFPWEEPKETGTVEYALDPNRYGHRLGFIGGTDSHDTQPGSVCDLDAEYAEHPYGGGLTVVILDEGATFDRSGIYESLVARSTYATSGPLLPALVEYWVGDTWLADMGQEPHLDEAQDIDVRLWVPAEMAVYVEQVILRLPNGYSDMTMVASDASTWSATLPADDLPPYVYPEVFIDGTSWYGEGVCNDGGDSDQERLWLSPTWFDVGDEEPQEDVDEDGYTVEEGDCDDTDRGVNPGRIEVCGSGKDEDCNGLTDGEDPACDTGAPDTSHPADTSPPASDTGPGAPPDDTAGAGGGKPGSRFCATSSPSGLAPWLLLLLPLIIRRRSPHLPRLT